jgi:hypothetical protein
VDRPDSIKVTRQDLYEQIWSMPVSRACRIYGLSDVGLAKICDQWDIPRPPRGYWAKKRNGQLVRQRKLPPIEEGNPVIFSYDPQSVGAPEPKREPKREPSQSDRQRAFEKLPENQIAVADQLADPHPFVGKTETSIRRAQPEANGLVCPKARRCLDLTVSPTLIDRSLRILNAILKALEARGLRVSITDGEHPRTQVRVLDENIGFRLYEATARQERLPTPKEIEWELRWNPERKFYTTVPSGKLVLRITEDTGSHRSWTDRGDRPVEQILNSFVIGLYRAAEWLKQERINAVKRRQEQEEQERRRQEEEQERRKEREEQERLRQEAERRRREEEARMHNLDAEAAAWTKAHQIRAYLAAIRQVVLAESGEIVQESELARWLQWAEGRANAIDPLMQRPWPR